MGFEQFAQGMQIWSKAKSKSKNGKICAYCGFDNHGNAKACIWCKGDKDEFLEDAKINKGE